jgi:hypothetical protein
MTLTKDQARAEVRLELIGVVHLAKLDGLTRAEFEDLAAHIWDEVQLAVQNDAAVAEVYAYRSDRDLPRPQDKRSGAKTLYQVKREKGRK